MRCESVRTRVESWKLPEQRNVAGALAPRLSRAHQAFKLRDRHRAVVLRLDLGVGVELEHLGVASPRPVLLSLTHVSPAAAAISSNRSQASA